MPQFLWASASLTLVLMTAGAQGYENPGLFAEVRPQGRSSLHVRAETRHGQTKALLRRWSDNVLNPGILPPAPASLAQENETPSSAAQEADCDTCKGGCIISGKCFLKDPITGRSSYDLCDKYRGKMCEEDSVKETRALMQSMETRLEKRDALAQSLDQASTAKKVEGKVLVDLKGQITKDIQEQVAKEMEKERQTEVQVLKDSIAKLEGALHRELVKTINFPTQSIKKASLADSDADAQEKTVESLGNSGNLGNLDNINDSSSIIQVGQENIDNTELSSMVEEEDVTTEGTSELDDEDQAYPRHRTHDHPKREAERVMKTHGQTQQNRNLARLARAEELSNPDDSDYNPLKAKKKPDREIERELDRQTRHELGEDLPEFSKPKAHSRRGYGNAEELVAREGGESDTEKDEAWALQKMERLEKQTTDDMSKKMADDMSKQKKPDIEEQERETEQNRHRQPRLTELADSDPIVGTDLAKLTNDEERKVEQENVQMTQAVARSERKMANKEDDERALIESHQVNESVHITTPQSIEAAAPEPVPEDDEKQAEERINQEVLQSLSQQDQDEDSDLKKEEKMDSAPKDLTPPEDNMDEERNQRLHPEFASTNSYAKDVERRLSDLSKKASLFQGSAGSRTGEQSKSRFESLSEKSLDDLDRRELALAENPGAEEMGAEDKLQSEIQKRLGVSPSSNAQQVLLLKDNELVDPNWHVQKVTPAKPRLDPELLDEIDDGKEDVVSTFSNKPDRANLIKREALVHNQVSLEKTEEAIHSRDFAASAEDGSGTKEDANLEPGAKQRKQENGRENTKTVHDLQGLPRDMHGEVITSKLSSTSLATSKRSENIPDYTKQHVRSLATPKHSKSNLEPRPLRPAKHTSTTHSGEATTQATKLTPKSPTASRHKQPEAKSRPVASPQHQASRPITQKAQATSPGTGKTKDGGPSGSMLARLQELQDEIDMTSTGGSTQGKDSLKP